jgi:hypothetical protein
MVTFGCCLLDILFKNPSKYFNGSETATCWSHLHGSKRYSRPSKMQLLGYPQRSGTNNRESRRLIPKKQTSTTPPWKLKSSRLFVSARMNSFKTGLLIVIGVQHFGWVIILTILVGWRNEHLPLNKTARVRAVPHSTVGDVFSQTFSRCKYLEVVMHMQFNTVVQGHMFHIELWKWLQSTLDTLACTQGKQFTSVKADNLNNALNTSL